MKNWMNALTSNWSFMRALRVILGGMMVAGFLVNGDALSGILGLILLTQGLANVGCCSSVGCVPPAGRRNEQNEVTYEEVK